MTVRIFKCRSCRHKMRFGAEYCGRCGRKVQVFNVIPFYIFVVSSLCLLLLAV